MDKGAWWQHSMGSQSVRYDWAANTFTFKTLKNKQKQKSFWTSKSINRQRNKNKTSIRIPVSNNRCYKIMDLAFGKSCSLFWSSLVAQLVKNPPAMWETYLIPGLGRSPIEGKGYALQYSGLENSMDCIVRGVTKSRTWLSDFHFHWAWPEPRRLGSLLRVPLAETEVAARLHFWRF